MKIFPIMTWSFIIIGLHLIITQVKSIYLDNIELNHKLLNVFESNPDWMWKEQKYPQVGPTAQWAYDVGPSRDYQTTGTDSFPEVPDFEKMKKSLEEFVKDVEGSSPPVNDRGGVMLKPYEMTKDKIKPRDESSDY